MATQDANQSGYTAVLDVIRDWPVEQRLALMHDIVRTLVPSDTLLSPKNTWEQASGLLAGPWPAPTDWEEEQDHDD